MQSQPNPKDGAPANKRRRWTLAGVAAATVAGVGAAMAWHGGAHAHGGRWGRGRHGEPMDPEAMGRRIDGMVQWMLADIDATDEQRTRVAQIAKAAAAELAPLRAQHFDARKKTVELLARPTIDRAQIERVRVEQMQLGDQVTKRMTQALLDAADVLSPQQRVKLAERWEQRRGRHHRG